GYRKSPIEDVLPVSLELRQEQRKAALAMSIVLDSSGSMGVAVPDGRTKMQLAAEGVVAALQLLNPKDDASVFLVDTTPHEIFDMRPVASGLPLDKVARAFTGGGGIYIGVGLATAKREIDKSSKPTRHVLLFADASDSEEPADYEHTIAKLVADGVTVSVIGMGKRTDSDADLLVDVARLGGGRIYFAEDVLSLPRIFSQETIAVARSSFVDVAVPLALGPDLSLLGALSAAGLPRIGGYNLTYLKAQASLGLRSDDDNRAPVVAFWQRGAGRVVTITAEVDGQHTGDLANWSERRALLENAVRWTMPTEPGVVDAAARARLVGDDLHVTLDFDPKTPPLGNATLVVLAGDGRAEPALVPMSWEDYDRVGAHFKVHGSGVFHPVVRVGARTFRAPAVTLAYAPEFEPGSARGGKELLAALAKASHGKERLTMAGVFAGTTASASREPFAPWLVALAVVMLLCEVSVRRFWPERRRTGRKKVAPPAPSALARTTTAAGRTDPVVQATHSVRADAPAHPSPAPGQPTVGNVESAIERALHRTRKRTER
ncbi:MAG TPA: vWA domain-containing protein, partial [Polyangiaceae bacterium]|nr:vWA domain-containing protein [Polyangiaceae bacterium]